MAKNLNEALFVNIRIKHNVDIEAFCAVAAPAISLGADIATAENLEITWEFNKLLDDLEFVHAAKEAEIMNFIAEVSLKIVFKVSFEFIALGILVIDSCTGDIAFVCGGFVADDDISQVIQIGNDCTGECEHARKRHVSVIEFASFIEFEDLFVDS